MYDNTNNQKTLKKVIITAPHRLPSHTGFGMLTAKVAAAGSGQSWVPHSGKAAQPTVKVPLSQPCFDHFFGPCFRGHDEAGLLAFSMSLFSDVGPLEAIAENKTEQKLAAKRRQRLLKAPLKPPSYDARFPTARSV